MAHCYSHLYNLPTTGLRFFKFMDLSGVQIWHYICLLKLIIKKINIFNKGRMFRDFTFVEDIADGVLKVLNKKPKINKNFNHFKPITSNSMHLTKFLILEMVRKFI